MTSEGLGAALAKRLIVAVAVAVVIVAAAFAIPAATDAPETREPLNTPEYDAEALAATPIPAEGEIDADGSLGNRDGVVVIDQSHSNRVDRSDLQPLVEELVSIGYGVRFYDGEQSLGQELSNANAFVVIDPADEFERDEITEIREYTDEGGHLLMVGEPNRKRVSASFFGTSISNQESALTTLAGRYDMSLGTAYLYNLETNGGNYKHVVASPTPESELELERVTMFTAAAVHARDGTVLLRTAANTHESGIDGSDRYPVAVYDEDDNAILVGDSTFLEDTRFNVGENEQFAAYLVEFLISGEHVNVAPDGEDDGIEDGTTDDDGDGDGNGTGLNNTTTPSPVTPTTSLDEPNPSGGVPVDATASVSGAATATGIGTTDATDARPVEAAGPSG
jgi:hypothetical protein